MAEVGDAGSVGCSYDFHDTLNTTMIVDSSQDHPGSWDALSARITLKFSHPIAMRIVNTCVVRKFQPRKRMPLLLLVTAYGGRLHVTVVR